MSSISESISHLTKSSSSTTTVPEISSATDSSSNRSLIKDLRQRIELLKVQLSQRERELANEKWEKEEESVVQNRMKTELRQLQTKTIALTEMCNDLLAFVRQNEEEETSRSREMERFYKESIKTLTESGSSLRAENGQLRQKLSVCEGKITAVIHENNFLRWDADARTKELQDLKRKYEESCRELTATKSEAVYLAKDLRETKRSQSEKIETEIEEAVRSTTTKIEKVKRVQDDREKEYGLTLTRMQNEIDFLRSEVERKAIQAERLTEMMDQLTIDNKKLYEFHGNANKDFEEEREQWKAVVSHREAHIEKLKKQREDLQSSLDIWKEGAKENEINMDDAEQQLAEKEQQLETARSNAATLRKQLAEVTAVKEMSLPELRRELKVKTAKLIEVENKLEVISKDYKEEQTQRIDSAIIIAEMTKDMKIMINVLKN